MIRYILLQNEKVENKLDTFFSKMKVINQLQVHIICLIFAERKLSPFSDEFSVHISQDVDTRVHGENSPKE